MTMMYVTEVNQSFYPLPIEFYTARYSEIFTVQVYSNCIWVIHSYQVSLL